MGWQDKLENNLFSITTGDGQNWFPDWKGGETSKEFNASVFDFINVAGSLIDRKKVKARKFPLVFWFQGEDNIDKADAFDKSAEDSRAWVVNHPYYGSITGQPISVSRNDANFNITEITVDFWETITLSPPKATVSINDILVEKTIVLNTISAEEYGSKVDLKAADIVTITESANKFTALIQKKADDTGYSKFILAKNEMFSKIDSMITYPVEGMKIIQDVLMQPAQFQFSVGYRVKLTLAVLENFYDIVTLNPTRNNSLFFQSASAMILASYANILINPLGIDYVTKGDVATASLGLSLAYNRYVAKLDSLYVNSIDPKKSFAASATIQSNLQGIILDTLMNLQSVAFNAKQERIIYLEKDTALIPLVHKYVGLDEKDENIDTFRKVNNIKGKGLFVVPKGKKIKYYV